jgi:hypothetical protein
VKLIVTEDDVALIKVRPVGEEGGDTRTIETVSDELDVPDEFVAVKLTAYVFPRVNPEIT